MKYEELLEGDEIHIIHSHVFATWTLIDVKFGYNGVHIGYNIKMNDESYKYLLERDEYESLTERNRIVVQRDLEDNDPEGLFKATLSGDILSFLLEYADK